METKPVTRQLGPSTRVVETGLKSNKSAFNRSLKRTTRDNAGSMYYTRTGHSKRPVVSHSTEFWSTHRHDSLFVLLIFCYKDYCKVETELGLRVNNFGSVRSSHVSLGQFSSSAAVNNSVGHTHSLEILTKTLLISNRLRRVVGSNTFSRIGYSGRVMGQKFRPGYISAVKSNQSNQIKYI